jgi:hypothetical protein
MNLYISNFSRLSRFHHGLTFFPNAQWSLWCVCPFFLTIQYGSCYWHEHRMAYPGVGPKLEEGQTLFLWMGILYLGMMYDTYGSLYLVGTCTYPAMCSTTAVHHNNTTLRVKDNPYAGYTTLLQ